MYRFRLVLVMIIWGSLGVFTRSVPLSALNLAFLRALIALPVLLIALRRKKIGKVEWKNCRPYIASGILLGLGWLTLFYGFKHTSIASAVIIYNMCPVYVLIAAPFVLKERITGIQVGVIVLSFIGLLLIVGSNLVDSLNLSGMMLSAVSGVMYAIIVLINRKIDTRLENTLATFIQIMTAMLVLLPFVIAGGSIVAVFSLSGQALVLVILLGVVHTGVAYTLFFSVYAHMRSVEVVSFSYLEPLIGIVFSFLLLGETLGLYQIVGGILILGSTFVGELLKSRRERMTPKGTDPKGITLVKMEK